MTSQFEINNRPINQAAAYWMKQEGEEPEQMQPMYQLLLWETERGLTRMSGYAVNDHDRWLIQQIAEADDQEWAYRELVYMGGLETLDADAIKKAGSPRNAAALLLEVWEQKYPEPRD